MTSTIPAAVRREVAERYGLTPGATKTLQCRYCDATTEAYWPLGHRGKPTYWPMFGRGFALDHVLPQARGGKHEATNLVLSCTPCNSRKRDRIIPVATPGGVAESPATERGATPQGKGREGIRKGREGIVVLHSSHLTTAKPGLWITHRPATRPPMQRSDDGGLR